MCEVSKSTAFNTMTKLTPNLTDPTYTKQTPNSIDITYTKQTPNSIDLTAPHVKPVFIDTRFVDPICLCIFGNSL